MTTEGGDDKTLIPAIKEKDILKKDLIIKSESTNFQWGKLSMNFGILILMIISKLVRGPGGGEQSAIGLDICDGLSWVAFAVLALVAFALTALAAKISNQEYSTKKSVDYDFTAGD